MRCTSSVQSIEEVQVTGKRKLLAVAASGVMAVAGVVAASAPSLGGTTTVRATGSDTWNPASKTVATGTKVVWKNPTDDDHNVAAYRGSWSKKSALGEGASTSFKFGRAGTYNYRCTLHSKLSDGKCQGMCGKIVVR